MCLTASSEMIEKQRTIGNNENENTETESRSNPGFWDFIILESIYISHSADRMKRMFSKKGLVESSKEENMEDVESDADLQE